MFRRKNRQDPLPGSAGSESVSETVSAAPDTAPSSGSSSSDVSGFTAAPVTAEPAGSAAAPDGSAAAPVRSSFAPTDSKASPAGFDAASSAAFDSAASTVSACGASSDATASSAAPGASSNPTVSSSAASGASFSGPSAPSVARGASFSGPSAPSVARGASSNPAAASSSAHRASSNPTFSSSSADPSGISAAGSVTPAEEPPVLVITPEPAVQLSAKPSSTASAVTVFIPYQPEGPTATQLEKVAAEAQKALKARRKADRKRLRLWKKDARQKAVGYLRRLRDASTPEERTTVRNEYHTDRRAWRKSIKELDESEKKLQKKAYRTFRRRITRTRRLICCFLVLALLAGTCFAAAPLWKTGHSLLALDLTPDTALRESAAEALRSVSGAAADEGIVLLKNKDSLLPLQNKKICVFGEDAYTSGSGDASPRLTLFEGLEAAGISFYMELHSVYSSVLSSQSGLKKLFSGKNGGEGSGFPAGTDYSSLSGTAFLSDELMASCRDYTDQAMVVLSCRDADGTDFSSEELTLSAAQEALLRKVAGTFPHVIVVLSGSNMMETGITDKLDSVESVLWTGCSGPEGTASLGKILSGEVNPSGRLTDTWAYSCDSAPASVNFTTDPERYISSATGLSYIQYEEGIYVGYRYYETAYAGNESGYWKAVQYPFGYGLSYTDFAWETVSFGVSDATESVSESDRTISDAAGNVSGTSESVSNATGTVFWKVRVTNTGDTAGKDVLQLYFTPPYGVEAANTAATSGSTANESAAAATAANASALTESPANGSPAAHGISVAAASSTANDTSSGTANFTSSGIASSTANFTSSGIASSTADSSAASSAEKSTMNLVAYAKTPLLSPGEDCELTLTFSLQDLACYSTEESAWITDPGDYTVHLCRNAHDAAESRILRLLSSDSVINSVPDSSANPVPDSSASSASAPAAASASAPDSSVSSAFAPAASFDATDTDVSIPTSTNSLAAKSNTEIPTAASAEALAAATDVSSAASEGSAPTLSNPKASVLNTDVIPSTASGTGVPLSNITDDSTASASKTVTEPATVTDSADSSAEDPVLTTRATTEPVTEAVPDPASVTVTLPCPESRATENLFSYASGGISVLSRSDWTGSYPRGIANDPGSGTLKADLREYSNPESSSAAHPETDANNGIKLASLRGLSYDDPLWSDYLDQFSMDELFELSANAGWHTSAVRRLGIPETKMLSGNTSLSIPLHDLDSDSFPPLSLVAATWNDELAQEYGKAVGLEVRSYGAQIWYGPSLTLHRTAHGGINLYSCSEDPLLTGSIASAVVRGAQSEGVIAAISGFGAGCEASVTENGTCVFADEQALRELYLRPFEIAVRDGGAKAVVTSGSRLGCRWSGADATLLTEQLRDEWGFEGFVTTEAVNASYMRSSLACAAGTDLMRETGLQRSERALRRAYSRDPAGTALALRNAAHHFCYTLVNCSALFTE